MLLAVATAHGDWRTAARPAWLPRRPRVPTTEWCWLAAWGLLAVASTRLVAVTDDPADLLVHQAVNRLAAVLLVTPVVLGAAGVGLVARVLTWRPIVVLGLLSYGAYLWHLDVLVDLPGPWVAHPFGPAVGGMLVKLAAAVALGAVSYAVVEQPFMRGAARAVRRWRLA